MRLLLVRHGQTDYNAERLIQGRTDTPLNDTGHEQARILANRLAGEEIDLVYASPLRRAWETATVLARPHQVPLLSDPRLEEAGYGIWEGMTWKQVQSRFPLAFAEWAIDHNRVPEGAETFARMVIRARSFMGEIHELHRDKDLLVVTHGGPLKVLVCIALGLPIQKSFDLATDNAAVTELAITKQGTVLVRHNDAGHLWNPAALVDG